jgi:hypothetical protein
MAKDKIGTCNKFYLLFYRGVVVVVVVVDVMNG